MSDFDEAHERKKFIERYELNGLIAFDGKYWIPVKPDPLLQGTIMIMYDAWIESARCRG